MKRIYLNYQSMFLLSYVSSYAVDLTLKLGKSFIIEKSLLNGDPVF